MRYVAYDPYDVLPYTSKTYNTNVYSVAKSGKLTKIA